MARRTKAEMELLRCQIFDTAREIQPCTIRQLFYQLVSRGYIDKTEGAYKGTVVRLVGEMRLEGTLPWRWVNDNTRWMRRPSSHGSMADILHSAAATYTRSLWQDADAYVEVWLEKDALSGVFYDVTGELQVPLMVTRGYPSLTFLHDSAQTIKRQNKPTHIYYFGDYDPSGCDISRNVEERIREFVGEHHLAALRRRYVASHGEAETERIFRGNVSAAALADMAKQPQITFTRVAVNQPQIAEMNLPTRPTKKSDTRSKNFEGDESVEVDAIPPDTLRRMIRDCVMRHIDPGAIEASNNIQRMERESLRAVASKFTSFGGDADAFLGAMDDLDPDDYVID